MKILITGENSYAGNEFAKRVMSEKRGWKIDFLSVRDEKWKSKDFTPYDAVYHVAGIVHNKESKISKEIYYRVNRDLSYELALKSKKEGVSTFVFLSTMAVYGETGRIGRDTIITKNTKPNPTSCYGKSKLEAEGLLNTLQDSTFCVSLLRIPMIYGPSCPGNYQMLRKVAKLTPLFPKITNNRSMIFINHLSDFVMYLMENRISGVLMLKNPSDVSTLNMVLEIKKYHNKKMRESLILGMFVYSIGNYFNTTRKIFGNITFADEDCSVEGFNFKKINFNESIFYTEKNNEG